MQSTISSRSFLVCRRNNICLCVNMKIYLPLRRTLWTICLHLFIIYPLYSTQLIVNHSRTIDSPISIVQPIMMEKSALLVGGQIHQYNRDGIFKLLKSPGIDSKESIPAAFVAWRICLSTLFLLGSQPPQIVLKIPAQDIPAAGTDRASKLSSPCPTTTLLNFHY